MKMYQVTDPEFAPYGQVITGIEDAAESIANALLETDQPSGVGYVPSDPVLQTLPAADIIRDHCFGGMPVQMGWCNGFNRKLNCLEYHKSSEFNLGAYDFILLLARQDEIENGMLDTAKVKAFYVPAGVLVEVYATSLHYAPCHADNTKGFRVLIALPEGTNTDRISAPVITPEDAYMTAKNKWLYAHPESQEAKDGSKVGLCGVNIDLDAM